MKVSARRQLELLVQDERDEESGELVENWRTRILAEEDVEQPGCWPLDA